jgi:hypothetical protein
MPRHKIPKQRVVDNIRDDIYWCDPGLSKATPTAKCLPCPPAFQVPVEALIGEVTWKAAAFEQAELRARMAEQRCKQLESMLEMGQKPMPAGLSMQTVMNRDAFAFTEASQVSSRMRVEDPPPRHEQPRQQVDGRAGKRHGYGRIPPPSRGSKNHMLKQCRPCRRLFTPGGCPDGALCNFCHYAHDVKDNKSEESRDSRDVSTADSENQEETPQEKRQYDLFESPTPSQPDDPWYVVPTMNTPWYVSAKPPGLEMMQ